MWKGLDSSGKNVSYAFSPCSTLVHTPCEGIPFASRSVLCQLDGWASASLMTYRPENTKWIADVIGGVPVLTMVMKGPSSGNPFLTRGLIVNYWCDIYAYRPFIINVLDNTTYDNLSIVDIRTHLSCSVTPLSSTGSTPGGDEGATEAHVILVIALGALLLIFTCLLCVRARHHVERWSYVEEYTDQQDTSYDDSYLPPPHRIESHSSADVEICHPEYRKIS